MKRRKIDVKRSKDEKKSGKEIERIKDILCWEAGNVSEIKEGKENER